MTVRLPLIVAVLGVAVAAGCTTTSEGTPLPANSTDAPSTDAGLPSDGAPKVENPLDVSQFEQNPCDVLKPEDAQELNVPATGEPTDDAFGPGCHWRNSQTRGDVVIQFSSDEIGLSSLYREAKAADWPYFTRVDDIESYPAVAYDPKVDKPEASCAVAVGLSDQLAVNVNVSLSDAKIGEKDPCVAAMEVAGMAMETMLAVP